MKTLTIVKIVLLVVSGWLTVNRVISERSSFPQKHESHVKMEDAWKELASAQPILAQKYTDAKDRYETMYYESSVSEPLYQLILITFAMTFANLLYEHVFVRFRQKKPTSK